MAREQKNLPIDHKWKDALTLAPGTSGPHVFSDGEYIETTYYRQEFPKTKYHPDYVHDRKEGETYDFTQLPQVVNSPEEEEALGPEWKDSPADFGMVTEPDAAAASEKKKKLAAAGSNWRAALHPNVNLEVTEMHLRFAQAQGAELKTLADLYSFLAGMTSQQMRSFMQEAQQWGKAELDRARELGKAMGAKK